MKKLTTEYLPLESIKRAPRNPKDHDLGAIHRSIERFGFAVPMLMDDRTGRLVAGHGRLDALIQLKKAGGAPPPGVLKGKGDWLVPVTRGNRFASDADAEAYLVADNMLVELGGWKPEELAQVLKDAAKVGTIEFTGYDQDDLDQILKDVGEITSGGKDDEVPKPPKVPVSKPGDLWQMGEHRILCGDSTKAEDVKRVMGDDRAGLLATDPPFGIAYSAGTDGKGVRPKGSGKRGGWTDIENDVANGPELQAFLESCFRVAVEHAVTKTAAWYLWHAQLTQGFFAAAAAAAAADILIHRQIIWVKPQFLFGRGDYHWKHELCFYGWVKSNRPPFYGKHNQTTVWEMGNETTPVNRVHPTQKPVELFVIPIRNHTKPGEVVYEPFSGSGTQIIAAAKTGRRCRAIEIAPAYVDVAVQRWQKFTGKKATLVKP